MPTYTAEVGSDRQVTLPNELCERLGIVAGTMVEFFLTLDGQVHFHALSRSAREFGGILDWKRSPPSSIREMDDGIAAHLAEKHERILRQAREDHESLGEAKPAAE